MVACTPSKSGIEDSCRNCTTPKSIQGKAAGNHHSHINTGPGEGSWEPPPPPPHTHTQLPNQYRGEAAGNPPHTQLPNQYRGGGGGEAAGNPPHTQLPNQYRGEAAGNPPTHPHTQLPNQYRGKAAGNPIPPNNCLSLNINVQQGQVCSLYS